MHFLYQQHISSSQRMFLSADLTRRLINEINMIMAFWQLSYINIILNYWIKTIFITNSLWIKQK